jgi:hypothetical protein
VCQFGQDRFFHSPDLSGYCPWEQALLNQETLWSVQTKFFDFVQWLKDTFITNSEKLVSAEQETWVEVLRRIGEDKELSAHLFEEGLSTHSCLKKGKYVSVCKFCGVTGWGVEPSSSSTTPGCPSDCSICAADRADTACSFSTSQSG